MHSTILLESLNLVFSFDPDLYESMNVSVMKTKERIEDIHGYAFALVQDICKNVPVY